MRRSILLLLLSVCLSSSGLEEGSLFELHYGTYGPEFGLLHPRRYTGIVFVWGEPDDRGQAPLQRTSFERSGVFRWRKIKLRYLGNLPLTLDMHTGQIRLKDDVVGQRLAIAGIDPRRTVARREAYSIPGFAFNEVERTFSVNPLAAPFSELEFRPGRARKLFPEKMATDVPRVVPRTADHFAQVNLRWGSFDRDNARGSLLTAVEVIPSTGDGYGEKFESLKITKPVVIDLRTGFVTAYDRQIGRWSGAPCAWQLNYAAYPPIPGAVAERHTFGPSGKIFWNERAIQVNDEKELVVSY